LFERFVRVGHETREQVVRAAMRRRPREVGSRGWLIEQQLVIEREFARLQDRERRLAASIQ
jgi:hypothetical protein